MWIDATRKTGLFGCLGYSPVRSGVMRSIPHTGAELGEDHVELSQNQIDPQRPSTIAAFSSPRKYDFIEYAGRRHFTKMILRSLEEFEGDGATETFDLDTRRRIWPKPLIIYTDIVVSGVFWTR